MNRLSLDRRPCQKGHPSPEDAPGHASRGQDHHDHEAALLRQAVEALTDGFVLFDADQRLVLCNERYREIYRPVGARWAPGTHLRQVAEDTARHCVGLTEDDAVGRWVEGRLEAASRPGPWVGQRLSDGRWIRVGEVRLANGWTVGVRTDITDLKGAQEAHRSSDARFRDFAESAVDWFWELDENLRFSFVSERFRDLTGLDPRMLLGRTLEEALDLTSEGDEDQRAELLETLAARGSFRALAVAHRLPGGERRVLEMSAKALLDAEGAFVAYRGVGRDVTEGHRIARRLTYEATHDPLTGLVNRREFERRLASAVDEAREHGSEHVLCYLDLDRFKLVNDSCGHAGGDELLRQLARVLRGTVQRDDTLGRLGGDEFGLLLEHCAPEQAQRVAEDMRRSIEEFRFAWGERTFDLGASVGLVSITDGVADASSAIQAADAACYDAKKQGRNRVYVPGAENTEVIRRRGEELWVCRIQEALDEERFQPVEELPDVTTWMRSG